MKGFFLPLFIVLLFGCSNRQAPLLSVKTELPKELKEISGMAADGKDVWVITDKPHANIFRLDTVGHLLQEINVTNVAANDVESVTVDKDFIYMGDAGDNDGTRQERQIIKVAKAGIGNQPKVQTTGQVITFTFPQEGDIESKKQNNYDCESVLSYKDSLYVFTKDREDNQTRLYAIPKTPGNYSARLIDSFNSKGLVTDAAINQANNEVTLIGYHKGHTYPFMIVFTGFKGDDFLSGSYKRIELADKDWDWQLESVTYNHNDMVYFSCEGTDEVPATFYAIKRDKLFDLNKKATKGKQHKQKGPHAHMSTKGHLKF